MTDQPDHAGETTQRERPTGDETPMGVRRGYVRLMTIAMAAVAAFAIIWAIAQAVIQ